MAPVAEPLHDLADRLDLVQGHGLAPGLGRRPHPQQPAQGRQVAGLVVDGVGVLLEDLVALGPGGVLELEDGLRVEEVVLALAAPLPVPARVEVAVRQLARAVGPGGPVPGQGFGRYALQADALDLAWPCP